MADSINCSFQCLISQKLTFAGFYIFSWWVPISHSTPNQGFDGTKSSVWLSPEEETKTIVLDGPLDEDQPLVVNVQQTGFYRSVARHSKQSIIFIYYRKK